MTKKVEIYTTPSCTYCKMTKEFFKQNNVEYSEYDVVADAAKRQEMIDKSGQMGVPVIRIADPDGSNESFVVGFNKPQLASLLGIA